MASSSAPAVLGNLVDNLVPPCKTRTNETRMSGTDKPPTTLPASSSGNNHTASSSHVAIRNPYARSTTPAANTNAPTKITNPYAKPPATFVGGSERARKTARRQMRRGKPVAVPRNAEDLILSNRMHPFDRFFACLLHPSVSSYYISATQEEKALEMWTTLCARVGIPIVKEPLRASYPFDVHLQNRTALILEEARHAVSDALQVAWNQRRKPMHLTLTSVERGKNNNKNAGSRLGFRKNRSFSKEEMFTIRPGTVVLCMARNDPHVVTNAVLGVIVSGNRDSVEKDHSFTVLCFHAIKWNDQEECTVAPLAPLVSECRAFEALVRMPETVDFFATLVSGRKSKRTCFDGDGNEIMQDNSAYNNSMSNSIVKVPESNPHFDLKPLNATQENAAEAFLHSDAGTLTLVQGPPGTGMCWCH